jgi:hypothetical protein
MATFIAFSFISIEKKKEIFADYWDKSNVATFNVIKRSISSTKKKIDYLIFYD